MQANADRLAAVVDMAPQSWLFVLLICLCLSSFMTGSRGYRGICYSPKKTFSGKVGEVPDDSHKKGCETLRTGQPGLGPYLHGQAANAIPADRDREESLGW